MTVFLKHTLFFRNHFKYRNAFDVFSFIFMIIFKTIHYFYLKIKISPKCTLSIKTIILKKDKRHFLFEIRYTPCSEMHFVYYYRKNPFGLVLKISVESMSYKVISGPI